LFAATANKYVVDANIPQTATTCLVDKIHEITFAYILFTLVASVTSLILYERGRHPERRTFDVSAGLILLISYIGIVLWYWTEAHVQSPL